DSELHPDLPEGPEPRQGDRRDQEDDCRTGGLGMSSLKTRGRPLSPNIQIYRPQLTSVLSIANRITGVVLSGFAVLMVVWLIAAAYGPETYSTVQRVMGSWFGQVLLLGC